MTEKHRVLCIDDDAISLSFLEETLKDHYDVALCIDSSEALAAAVRFKPHVVVSDFSMPGFTGADLLSLFDTLPDTRNIPFLAFTAHANIENLTELMKNGVRGLIEKPADPEFVLETVAYTIKHPTAI